MDFLYKRIFEQILSSTISSSKIKSGVNLTVARISRLSLEKMIQYFWSTLSTENAIMFSELLKAEELIRFEDVIEAYIDKYMTWEFCYHRWNEESIHCKIKM